MGKRLLALLAQKQALAPGAAQCGHALDREDSWQGLDPGMELGTFPRMAKNAALLNDQAHKEVSIRNILGLFSLPYQISPIYAPKTAHNLKAPETLAQVQKLRQCKVIQIGDGT